MLKIDKSDNNKKMSFCKKIKKNDHLLNQSVKKGHLL